MKWGHSQIMCRNVSSGGMSSSDVILRSVSELSLPSLSNRSDIRMDAFSVSSSTFSFDCCEGLLCGNRLRFWTCIGGVKSGLHRIHGSLVPKCRSMLPLASLLKFIWPSLLNFRAFHISLQAFLFSLSSFHIYPYIDYWVFSRCFITQSGTKTTHGFHIAESSKQGDKCSKKRE